MGLESIRDARKKQLKKLKNALSACNQQNREQNEQECNQQNTEQYEQECKQSKIEEIKAQINFCLSYVPREIRYNELIKELEELEKISSTLSIEDFKERLNVIREQYIHVRYVSKPYGCPRDAGHMGGHTIHDTLTGEEVAIFSEGNLVFCKIPNAKYDGRTFLIGGIVYSKRGLIKEF